MVVNEGKEECTEPELACTIHVSASQKKNGTGEKGADSAGSKPAAFLGATADGSQAYLMSSEMLTNDANTGTEQPPAQIGRADLTDPDPNGSKKEDFLSTHALGVAVDPKGEYIYWADPSLGTIGRAELNGSGDPTNPEPSFIEPGEGKCTREVKEPINIGGGKYSPAVFEVQTIPNAPRYVAVDEDHVYWTNTGRPDGEFGPYGGGSTIGRATLDGEGVTNVRSDFICGLNMAQPADPNQPRERLVSEPQGIAVNDTHIYWANAARSLSLRGIARAAIGGGEPEGDFVNLSGSERPYGLALGPAALYSTVEGGNEYGYISAFALEGEDAGDRLGFSSYLGWDSPRGLAFDGSRLYWAVRDVEPERDEGAPGTATPLVPAIGSMPVAQLGEDCGNKNPACEKEFLTPTGSPEGLAISGSLDPKGEYIYWADPSLGTIGRAELNGDGDPTNPESSFIEPGEGKCTQELDDPEPFRNEPAVFEDLPIPSAPRYVAVDEDHVYWTNTGLRNPYNPTPGGGGGTIGRATLVGEGVEDVKPDFICGLNVAQPADPNKPRVRLVSNPQGIAVNDTHIYWANAPSTEGAGGQNGIARAALDGTGAQRYIDDSFADSDPYGVALSPTHLYMDVLTASGASIVEQVPLAGGGVNRIGIEEARGLAVDSGYLYWAATGNGGAIGRIPLSKFGGGCSNPSCEEQFLTPSGSPEGLAISGSHLYWSVNGEAPANPGNDLYRYDVANGELTDVAPYAGGNGTEVRGILGASDDGSYLYFAANAVLA